MGDYHFDGYEMSDEQLGQVENVLWRMHENGLNRLAVDELWSQGLVKGNANTGEIEHLSAREGELVAQLLRDTEDIPYYVAVLPGSVDDQYYVLCIPSDDEDSSNFGGMNGIDSALETAEGSNYACAVVSYGDELPSAIGTTLIGIDCTSGVVRLA